MCLLTLFYSKFNSAFSLISVSVPYYISVKYDFFFFTGGRVGGGGWWRRVQAAPFDWPEAQKNSQLSWVISQAPLT